MLQEREDEMRIRHGAAKGLVDGQAPRAPGKPVARAGSAPHTGHRDHYQYCDSGFQPSGNPELDVWRLGALCGPSNGLERWEKLQRSNAGSEAAARFEFETEEVVCVRVAAAVEHGQAFEIEVSRNDQVVASCALKGAGWCPERGPACDGSGEPLVLELLLHGSQRLVAAQVWAR